MLHWALIPRLAFVRLPHYSHRLRLCLLKMLAHQSEPWLGYQPGNENTFHMHVDSLCLPCQVSGAKSCHLTSLRACNFPDGPPSQREPQEGCARSGFCTWDHFLCSQTSVGCCWRERKQKKPPEAARDGGISQSPQKLALAQLSGCRHRHLDYRLLQRDTGEACRQKPVESRFPRVTAGLQTLSQAWPGSLAARAVRRPARPPSPSPPGPGRLRPFPSSDCLRACETASPVPPRATLRTPFVRASGRQRLTPQRPDWVM